MSAGDKAKEAPVIPITTPECSRMILESLHSLLMREGVVERRGKCVHDKPAENEMFFGFPCGKMRMGWGQGLLGAMLVQLSHLERGFNKSMPLQQVWTCGVWN